MTKNKNTAPHGACLFSQPVELFSAGDKDGDNGTFKIDAYSGEIIPNHWYWGNLAFDLKGISFAKNVTPILEEHNRSARLGFSTKQEIADKVSLEGKFLSNEAAQQMRQDQLDGFPMQASVYIPPSVIEYVQRGSSVEVNGHTLNGPGAVFRKAVIHEVSMCTLGADGNTQTTAFADGGKPETEFSVLEKETQIMADAKDNKQVPVTAETFAAEQPELFGKITKAAKDEGIEEGKKKVRDSFADFVEQFGDDPQFCIDQFKAGATIEQATKAQNERLKEQLKKRPEKPDDPAHTEFSDQNDQTPPAAGDSEESLKAKFAADADLRAEFGNSEAAYLAYKKAEKAGRFRTHQK